jgi:hypothetical protein
VLKEYEKLNRESTHFEQRITQEGGLKELSQHDAEGFVGTHYKATGDEIYIVSFCGQHDDPYVSDNGLLSQWRGYGVGGGFAIVFDARRLKEMLKIEWERFEYAQMLLIRVVYGHEKKKLEPELSGDLSTIRKNVAHFYQVLVSGRVREERETCFRESYVPFFRCIARLKHRGFSEEKEIRLAALRNIPGIASLERAGSDDIPPKPKKEVKVRDRNGQLVPYIELFDSANMKLPIERIIVGPHKEKEARADALRQMPGNEGIDIKCSDIPYV